MAKAKLTGADLLALGFKPVHNRDGVAAFAIGPVHARLVIVLGYQDSGWWAMLVKYPQQNSLEHDASRYPHFAKRLYRVSDVKRLAAALGVELTDGSK